MSQHHAPGRVLPHTKRLDDCFGDYLVRVTCPCGSAFQYGGLSIRPHDDVQCGFARSHCSLDVNRSVLSVAVGHFLGSSQP